MSTPELRLKDPAYKNWVKAWLCLALVKKGLEDYAEIKSKEFHDAVLASVTKIQTYQTSICHNERITFDKNNDVKIACNHSFCQGFLNEVVNLGTDPTEKFKIRKANIENCDVKLWPTDHWELAKLFMNPGQKPYETNPSQTDLSGILNFLEHCQVPRNGIQNPQHIDEVRQTRNSVMLTPDMKVSPAMFQTDTQTMLDLLRDPNLSKLLSAKHAESEIQKVIQDDFQILLKDEYTVIEDWMTSLNNVTNDTTTEIKELRKEITSMQQTDEEEKKTLQTQIQQMKEETNKIKYSLSTLMKRVWTEGGPPGGYSLTKYLDGSIEQVIKDLQRAHNELKRQLEKTEQKLKDAAQKSEVLYDRDRLVKLELETSASKLQGAIIKAEERGVAEILSARSPHDEVLSLHHALIQKQYAVAKRLLENIGNRIKESKADDLLYVWPAYQEKQRLNPVFVALCQGYYQGEWDEVLGFRVYKRRFDYISPDTAKVINGQFLRTNNALIPKDIDISKHIASSEILKKHSNITIINACRYKSTNGSLIDQECIVIHCGMKGFIPIDEEPFPRYIGSHPVDVREGYFKLGMNTPPWTSSTSRRKLINGSFANSNSENAESGQLAAPLKASKTADRIKPRNKYSYNAKIKRFAPYSVPKREKGYNEMNDASVRTNIDDLCEEFQTLSMCQFGNRPSDVNEVLLMGTSISKQGGMSTGTLGGFVALPDRKVGFITCAHVFSEVDGKSLCEVEGKSVCQPSDGDVSIAQRQRR